MKTYTIKEFFKGSPSQLIKLGKQASELYRLEFNTNPPKREEPPFEVNCYPEHILNQLNKPVPNPITEIWCSPNIQKDVEHGWNCGYKPFNEFEYKIIPSISGGLTDISYEEKEYDGKITYKYNFTLSNLFNKVKYVYVSMNSGKTTRNKILGSFIKCGIESGDKVKIKILSGKNGWCEIITEVNDKPIINRNEVNDEEIIDFIKNNNNKIC